MKDDTADTHVCHARGEFAKTTFYSEHQKKETSLKFWHGSSENSFLEGGLG